MQTDDYLDKEVEGLLKDTVREDFTLMDEKSGALMDEENCLQAVQYD